MTNQGFQFKPEKIDDSKNTNTPNSNPMAQDSFKKPTAPAQPKPEPQPIATTNPQSSTETDQTAQKNQAPITKKVNQFKKYTLPNKWKFWLIIISTASGKNTRQTYQIEEISSFRQSDYFYQYFYSLPKMSELHCINGPVSKQISIALFSNDIQPAWEDPMNKKGGYYSFAIQNRNVIDDIWKMLCLRLIGNSLQHEFEGKLTLNGLYVKIRPTDCFELQFWIQGNQPKSPEVDQKFIDAIKRDILNASGYDFNSNSGRPEQQYQPCYRSFDRSLKTLFIKKHFTTK